MSETQLATRPTASNEVALRLGMQPAMMLDTFKAQCFRNAANVSDTQLAAFVSIARDMGVNPLLPGMLYAYPTTGGGIVPMMGPDGVYKKLTEHSDVDGWELKVFPESGDVPTHATATIYRKSTEHPISYTAWLSEWKVGSNPNWNSRPRHMLGLRALKQAARQIIHGLPYDEDDKVIGDLVNVTPVESVTQDAAPRNPPAERARGVRASKEEKARTVEAEIVAPTVAPDKQADSAPADKQSEHAKGAPAEQPAAKVVEQKPAEQPAKRTEKSAEKTSAAVPSTTITGLTDGQRVTFEGVVVDRYVKKDVNNQPSIEAELKGAFVGKVYHIGGADNPAWQLDNPITVTLVGKKLKSGQVASMVEKVEVSAESDALDLS